MNHKTFSWVSLIAFSIAAQAWAQSKESAVPEFDCVKAVAEADDIAGVAPDFGGDLNIENGKSDYASFVDQSQRKLYVVTKDGIYSTRIPKPTKKTPKYKWEIPKEGWTYQHLLKLRSESMKGGKPVYLEVTGGSADHRDFIIQDNTADIKTDPVPEKLDQNGWDKDGWGVERYSQAYVEQTANDDLSDRSKGLLLKNIARKLEERRPYIVQSSLSDPYAHGDKQKDKSYRENQLKKANAYLDRLNRCEHLGSQALDKTVASLKEDLKIRVGKLEAALGITSSPFRNVAREATPADATSVNK